MEFSDKDKRRQYLYERGIFPVRVPIPLIVNQVNVYYIDGPIPLVIDTGFFGQDSFSALEQGLSAIGRDIGKAGAVLLTHGHRDHSGMARKIRDLAESQVYLDRRDLPLLAPQSFLSYMDRVFDYYREMGVAPDRIHEIRRKASNEQHYYWEEAKRDDRAVIDGNLVAGDRFETDAGPLLVIGTPGHTAGSVSFFLEDQGILFSGDLISAAYDPLPLVGVDRDASGWRNSYDDLISSLGILSEFDPLLVLPGHGGPIPQARRLVERIMTGQCRIREKIEQLLRDSGEMTIAAVTEAVYPGAFGPILTTSLNVVRGVITGLVREQRAGFVDGDIVRFHRK